MPPDRLAIPLTALLLCGALPLLAASPASAAIPPIYEGEDTSLRLGGFASNLSGVQHLPYDTAGLLPDYSGVNAAIARLEWSGTLGERISFEIHDRFFWRLSDAGLDAGALGLGATIPPERTLDARSVILDEGAAYLEHDLDRLAVRLYTPWADISVGRQAITWGNASLFSVGDIWTQLSPFELDTSQKRGVDAVRVLSYPADGVEVEIVAADRGTLEHASAGARAGWTLGASDSYAAVAKSWDQLVALMGTAADLGDFRSHAEIEIATDPEHDGLRRPRATVGLDYWSSDLQAGLTYHYNGPGADDADEYIEAFGSPALARGQRYYVGRHYLGATLNYAVDETLSVATAVVGNLLDPSALIAPSATYLLSEAASLSLGGYVTLGERPELSLTSSALKSEFGTYPNIYFLQLSAYF